MVLGEGLGIGALWGLGMGPVLSGLIRWGWVGILKVAVYCVEILAGSGGGGGVGSGVGPDISYWNGYRLRKTRGYDSEAAHKSGVLRRRGAGIEP